MTIKTTIFTNRPHVSLARFLFCRWRHNRLLITSQWPDNCDAVRFCWVPSHCGIEGNEIVDQLAKATLDHDIDPLTTVHYADLKPLVNSYIQQEVQIKWDLSIHGRDLYLLKPTPGPLKGFRHLTRAEEVVITRLRFGHTKATKSHILSRGPPTACQHCGQTLTIEHILLECTVLQQSRDEYYTVDSLRTLWDDPRGLHNRISERSWIQLSDMNVHISNTTLYSNLSPTDNIIKLK